MRRMGEDLILLPRHVVKKKYGGVGLVIGFCFGGVLLFLKGRNKV